MEILKPFRDRLDKLDRQIVDLLVERGQIIREVGHLKIKHGIPAVLQDRIDEVRNNATLRAAEKGGDADLIYALYTKIIEYSCGLEEDIKDQDKKSA